jgi:predicted RNase H-like nuclease
VAAPDRSGRLASDDTLLFVDAPLIVDNASGQRLSERQVG